MEGVERLLRQRPRHGQRDIAQHDDELVAAPPDQLLVREALAQRRGKGAEHVVADRAAIARIDRDQPVDREQHHHIGAARQREFAEDALPAGLVERRGQPVAPGPGIAGFPAGDRVAQPGELAAQVGEFALRLRQPRDDRILVDRRAAARGADILAQRAGEVVRIRGERAQFVRLPRHLPFAPCDIARHVTAIAVDQHRRRIGGQPQPAIGVIVDIARQRRLRIGDIAGGEVVIGRARLQPVLFEERQGLTGKVECRHRTLLSVGPILEIGQSF